MRFKCDPEAKLERANEWHRRRIENLKRWHKRFAWLPEKMTNSKICIWLEFYETRLIQEGGGRSVEGEWFPVYPEWENRLPSRLSDN